MKIYTSNHVSDSVTIRQAGKILGVDQKFLKGVAHGMGIKLAQAAGALFMSREDFSRLKEYLESEEVPARK